MHLRSHLAPPHVPPQEVAPRRLGRGASATNCVHVWRAESRVGSVRAVARISVRPLAGAPYLVEEDVAERKELLVSCAESADQQLVDRGRLIDLEHVHLLLIASGGWGCYAPPDPRAGTTLMPPAAGGATHPQTPASLAAACRHSRIKRYLHAAALAHAHLRCGAASAMRLRATTSSKFSPPANLAWTRRKRRAKMRFRGR